LGSVGKGRMWGKVRGWIWWIKENDEGGEFKYDMFDIL
jgi:hypothetical protein